MQAQRTGPLWPRFAQLGFAVCGEHRARGVTTLQRGPRQKLTHSCVREIVRGLNQANVKT